MKPSPQKDSNIQIRITKDFSGFQIKTTELKKLVNHICQKFDLAEASVSIAVVDDQRITEINKQYLNCDRTTDCISFDLTDEHTAGSSFELIVNGQMAQTESSARGHSPQAELALYITHGLLHNLGYDDANDQDAKKMHETEDEILKQLGFGRVYNNDRERKG